MRRLSMVVRLGTITIVMERYLKSDAPVFGIVRLLLLPLLPIELADSLNDLARQVLRHPEIAIHSTKLWGELPESAQSAVKREVQIVARSVGDAQLSKRR